MAALPDELIDAVTAGRPGRRRARTAARFGDAGVGTLIVSPMAWEQADRLAQLAARRPDRVMRLFLGAFGDPGHAFPMLALGSCWSSAATRVPADLGEVARDAEAAGMTFTPAPEYQVFPTLERPLKPYEAAVRAARETVPSVRAFAPDAAVADILTLAPALAAELCGVPVATLVPHVHP